MNPSDDNVIGVDAEPSHSVSLADRLSATYNQIVQRIPAKARLPLLAAVVVLITLAVYASLSSGPAILNVVCHHNFRSAELSIAIDGKQSYSGEIFGSEKKRLGVGILGKQVEGNFSRSLHLPYGEHVVQVHLSSNGFDQTKRYGVNLSRGKDATLVITAQRGGLTLAYQGAPVSASHQQDSSASYLDSLRSVFLTALGTVLSASIGFVVTEFLKSRKAA
jgi:hypothetical protein